MQVGIHITKVVYTFLHIGKQRQVERIARNKTKYLQLKKGSKVTIDQHSLRVFELPLLTALHKKHIFENLVG